MAPRKTWFLRKNDGSEYGPVSIADLLRWSAQCRLVAGNAVSPDGEEWIPVEGLAELQMDWVAQRADGKEYGPFSLDAVQELFDHKVLPADAILVNRHTGENKPLAEVISAKAAAPEGRDAVARDTPAATGAESPPAPEPGMPKAPAVDAQEKESASAPPEERQAGDEPEDRRQAMAAAALQQQQEVESMRLEADTLRRQVDTVQRDLARARKAAGAQVAASAAQCDTLQAELDRMRLVVAEGKEHLNALAVEHRQALQGTAEDLTDLRKQTAFMKKNIAVLHAELEAARAQSRRRGKILLVLGVVLTVSAALLILRLAGGCRRPGPVVARGGAARRPAPGAEPTGAGDARGGAVRQPARMAPAARPAWPVLRGDGVRLIEEQGRLVIHFEDGVFARMDTLSPAAGARLQQLAAQLAPYMDRFRLAVEGHTDNIPMRATAAFADNQALALARADAVVRWLQREGGLPESAVNAVAEPGPPPFPNDTPENRQRNRTVVLLLVPR